MAKKAVARTAVSITLACRTFGLSETCYRYSPRLSDENEMIANLMTGLSKAKKVWGFWLCDLQLRSVKGHPSNHKGVYRTHRTLELNQIIEWRDRPEIIRVDNGPEHNCGKLMAWAEQRNILLPHLQPGKPQQNAYVERYNRTVRLEWLGRYMFESIREVKDYATVWLWTYNNEPPNMGIEGIIPAQKLKMPF